ncbi:hypothetical protein [Streptomyces sp. NPDC005485]|uniref:hypothetical protein n=1 Tax=Streptomyces sp. NPDC005485 TaxID=3155591 RepID=UPI0033A734E1
MSKRQVQKMLQLMAAGEPVELATPMSSVKKLARLAFVAQQFGYEYADARQGGRNGSVKMLVLPDHSPQAQARAAQNWAQYPQARDGVSLPPVVPDALELLKARINFDLTGKNAEKRMGYGVVGVSIGSVVLAYRLGGESADFVGAGIFWAIMMVVLGIGFVVTRKRNAKFAARLHAAGFTPVTEQDGRVRYLPPGAGTGAYAHQPYQPHPQQPHQQHAPGPYGQQPPPYAAGQNPHGQQAPAPAPYGQPAQPSASAPYSQQPTPTPYGQQSAPGAPYGQQPPTGPYAQPAQPAHPAQPYAPAPYGQQPPTGPYGQPPQQ